MQARLLSEIAGEIERTWPRVSFSAQPYLDAMSSLGKISDFHGLDPGREIVEYFLSNAASYKGEDARRIKSELKAMLRASQSDRS